MRKKLFQWHLNIGKYAGVLILIWATSGAVMTVQPLLLRFLDPGFPRLHAQSLNLAMFTRPPSSISGAAGAASVALRQFQGRSWYETTSADGSIRAFDANTGASVTPILSSEDVMANLGELLKGSRWTPRRALLMEDYDDQYRKGRLPVYKAEIDGPGRVILYISARDSNVEAVTTRGSRIIRWMGLGVHTWNFAAVMRSHDDERGLALCVMVALPLASLALIALLLLGSRRSEAGKRRPTRAVKRLQEGLVGVLILALIADTPARIANAAMRADVPSDRSPVRASPYAPGPRDSMDITETGSAVVSPAAVETPPSFNQDEALALDSSVGAEIVSPANSAPSAWVHTSKVSSGQENSNSSPEREALVGKQLFDGESAVEAPLADPPPVPLSAVDPYRSPHISSLQPPEPPQAPQHDRKARWGLYLTQAAHMTSLSMIWRIAWPLFVLEQIGKSGLGAVQAGDQIADMALGMVAGMIVDRLLPKGSMVAASFVRAGVGVAIMASALWWSPAMPFLLGASWVHVLAMSVLYVGQAAASPVAVGSGREALQRLNIVLKLISTGVAIPASLAGGWLVEWIGIPAAMAAYAALNAFVLAPMYHWLFPKPAAVERSRPENRAGMLDVLRFIKGHRLILLLLAATGTAMILAEPLRNTLIPILVKGVLHGNAALLGQVMTAFYVGQVAGSLALLRWPKLLGPERWMPLAALGFAASWILALGQGSHATLLLAVGLMTFLVQPAATGVKTLLQREVSDQRPDIIGRVMSVHLMVYALAVAGETAVIAWIFSSPGVAALACPGVVYAAGLTILASLVLLLGWMMRSNRSS